MVYVSDAEPTWPVVAEARATPATPPSTLTTGVAHDRRHAAATLCKRIRRKIRHTPSYIRQSLQWCQIRFDFVLDDKSKSGQTWTERSVPANVDADNAKCAAYGNASD